jgi:hypothetical protein
MTELAVPFGINILSHAFVGSHTFVANHTLAWQIMARNQTDH